MPVAPAGKPPRRVPVWLARLLSGELGVVMGTTNPGASNAKAKHELGWGPGSDTRGRVAAGSPGRAAEAGAAFEVLPRPLAVDEELLRAPAPERDDHHDEAPVSAAAQMRLQTGPLPLVESTVERRLRTPTPRWRAAAAQHSRHHERDSSDCDADHPRAPVDDLPAYRPRKRHAPPVRSGDGAARAASRLVRPLEPRVRLPVRRIATASSRRR